MITQDDVLYMIMTDRFADGDPANNRDIHPGAPKKRHGGDLLGIVQRLPYLKKLGVTALWITPVYQNPDASYHGYHPLDFRTVDPSLCSKELAPGDGPEVVKAFVDRVHAAGLKVVLDLIVNHTARGHSWLKERRDWFNPKGLADEKWWVWGLPDLNHDNIDVNVYMTRNVLGWITATGVDAVRMDAARHVESQFWGMLKLFVHGLCPTTTLIGEVWDEDPSRVAPYQALHGFDSMFDFPLQAAIRDVFAEDQGFARIARPELTDSEPQGILNQDKAYRNAYQLVTFLGNHDLPRFFREVGGKEREEGALARMRLALALLFTTRGIPQLYYGDELAMDGGPDPDNRRDMPWHLVDGPEDASPEATRAHAMFRYTQKVIRIRKESMALRYGLLVTLYVTPKLYAFGRIFHDDFRLVVLNNGTGPADLCIPIHANPRVPTMARKFLSDGLALEDELNGGTCALQEGCARVAVPARSAAIYRPVG